MKILYVPVKGPIETRNVDNDLETMQGLVGGYIETIAAGPEIVGIVNEEGILIGLPVNPHMRDMWLCGNVVFVRSGYMSEDFDSLEPGDITYLYEHVLITEAERAK